MDREFWIGSGCIEERPPTPPSRNGEGGGWQAELVVVPTHSEGKKRKLAKDETTFVNKCPDKVILYAEFKRTFPKSTDERVELAFSYGRTQLTFPTAYLNAMEECLERSPSFVPAMTNRLIGLEMRNKLSYESLLREYRQTVSNLRHILMDGFVGDTHEGQFVTAPSKTDVCQQLSAILNNKAELALKKAYDLETALTAISESVLLTKDARFRARRLALAAHIHLCTDDSAKACSLLRLAATTDMDAMFDYIKFNHTIFNGMANLFLLLPEALSQDVSITKATTGNLNDQDQLLPST